MLLKIVLEVESWLAADSENVAMIHCLAGKGRTGTTICCFLLKSQIVENPEEAFMLFAGKRFKDLSGVNQPSQVRYVRYFYQFLQDHNYVPTGKVLESIQIYDPSPKKTIEIYFKIKQSRDMSEIAVFKDKKVQVTKQEPFQVDFQIGTHLIGDITIYLKEFKAFMTNKEICGISFNTFYIEGNQLKADVTHLDPFSFQSKQTKFSGELTLVLNFKDCQCNFCYQQIEIEKMLWEGVINEQFVWQNLN